MSRELLKQALEALKGYRQNHNDHQPCDAEKAIETYLAQPEPVAWMVENHPANDTFVNFTPNFNSHFEKLCCKVTPLYAAPPERKPLSNEEIELLRVKTLHESEGPLHLDFHERFARAIEQHHGITE